MNWNTPLTLVLATLLVGSLAAGTAVAGIPEDVSPANYDLDVIDPDDRLSDADIDRAIQLARSDDAVQQTLDEIDSLEITVQALDDRSDVTVVFVDGPDRVAATIDLETDTVSNVSQNVATTGEVETYDGSDVNMSEDTGLTRIRTTDAQTVSTTESAEFEPQNFSVADDGDVITFDETPEPLLATAETEVIDAGDGLTAETESIVEELVTESDQVNGELGPVDEDSAWTLNVTRNTSDFWVDSDDRVVRVTVSQSDERPVAKAFVNLDEETVEHVVSVTHVDASEIQQVEFDDDAPEIVSTDEADGQDAESVVGTTGQADTDDPLTGIPVLFDVAGGR